MVVTGGMPQAEGHIRVASWQEGTTPSSRYRSQAGTEVEQTPPSGRQGQGDVPVIRSALRFGLRAIFLAGCIVGLVTVVRRRSSTLTPDDGPDPWPQRPGAG